jgi:hypothetical protein
MRTKTSCFIAAAFASIFVLTDLAPAQETVVQTTSSAGTITEFSPDSIVIRSETAPAPIHYVFRKTTTYVDDAGNPVSVEVVKSGLPVTVQYIKEGDQLIASRVVVHHRVVPAERVVPTQRVVPTERVVPTQRVVPAPPVIDEKTTTTTTTTTTK